MKNFDLISNRDLKGRVVHLNELLGKRVLANNGYVLGRVKEVLLNSKNLSLEGIYIHKGIGNHLIIGNNYIDKLTDDAVILKIYPSTLLKGKKIVNGEGEFIAKIREVIRKGHSNDILELVVYSFWKGKFNIPASAIKNIGENIILKNSYHAPKKYFWQKS